MSKIAPPSATAPASSIVSSATPCCYLPQSQISRQPQFYVVLPLPCSASATVLQLFARWMTSPPALRRPSYLLHQSSSMHILTRCRTMLPMPWTTSLWLILTMIIPATFPMNSTSISIYKWGSVEVVVGVSSFVCVELSFLLLLAPFLLWVRQLYRSFLWFG